MNRLTKNKITNKDNKPIVEQNQSPNKIGKFRISLELLRNWTSIIPLFNNMIILRAEHRYDTQTMDYVAYNPQFEILQYAEEPPEYKAIIEVKNGDNKITNITGITWVKV